MISRTQGHRVKYCESLHPSFTVEINVRRRNLMDDYTVVMNLDDRFFLDICEGRIAFCGRAPT